MRGFIKANREKTKDGKRGRVISYRLGVSLGRDPDTGKYDYAWETFRGTREEAEKRLADMVQRHQDGGSIKPNKISTTDYLERWLSDYARANLSPRSFERYQGIIRRHFTPAFGKIPLAKLKPEHLQKHYADIQAAGLSTQTVRYHHAVIRGALRTAVEWRLVPFNVAAGMRLPKKKHHDFEVWDTSEVGRFLEAAKDSPYYTLFFTNLYTGVRRSELLGLWWGDVDLIFSQISVSRGLHQLKGGAYVLTEPKSQKSRRSIALSPAVVAVLRHQREVREAQAKELGVALTDRDYVFAHADNNPWRPNSVTRAWQSLCLRAGLKPIRLHDARHTHASLMLKAGVHPKVVQERLGHSSIEMTLDIYSHVMPGLQEAAAARFEELMPKAPVAD